MELKNASPERATQNPSMSQSLTRNLIHLVYSTKERRDWIPVTIREKLWRYQAGIFQSCLCPALAIGGVGDHVHALFVLSKNHALKKVVEEVKKGSSKWMKLEGSLNRSFSWQAGYAAFSVSQSNVDSVTRYIHGQPQRHRRTTFQEELRLLLRKHEVVFDERYLWD